MILQVQECIASKSDPILGKVQPMCSFIGFMQPMKLSRGPAGMMKWVASFRFCSKGL